MQTHLQEHSTLYNHKRRRLKFSGLDLIYSTIPNQAIEIKKEKIRRKIVEAVRRRNIRLKEKLAKAGRFIKEYNRDEEDLL